MLVANPKVDNYLISLLFCRNRSFVIKKLVYRQKGGGLVLPRNVQSVHGFVEKL